MLAIVLIYNPVLINTLPFFSVACDWTEALVLLRNAEDVDRKNYMVKKKKIKNFFLAISIIVTVAMLVNCAAEIIKAFGIG